LHLVKHCGQGCLHFESLLYLVGGDERILAIFEKAWALMFAHEFNIRSPSTTATTAAACVRATPTVRAHAAAATTAVRAQATASRSASRMHVGRPPGATIFGRGAVTRPACTI
jgi:hypothetical protein